MWRFNKIYSYLKFYRTVPLLNLNEARKAKFIFVPYPKFKLLKYWQNSPFPSGLRSDVKYFRIKQNRFSHKIYLFTLLRNFRLCHKIFFCRSSWKTRDSTKERQCLRSSWYFTDFNLLILWRKSIGHVDLVSKRQRSKFFDFILYKIISKFPRKIVLKSQ